MIFTPIFIFKFSEVTMRKGQKLNIESRKKISESLKGRRCSMSTEFGRGHTP